MATPFSHENLPIKQHFTKLARDFYAQVNEDDSSDEAVGKELAAALLYMNLADYLAEYLVSGLNALAKEAMGKYYLGVLSVEPIQKDSFNIGTSITQLKRYKFPQKAEIIEELEAINKARKKIAHQMLKADIEQLSEMDQAVRDLVGHTESLVDIVDEISMGLPPKNLVEKLIEDPVATQQEAEDVSDTTKK